jgi:hypothetical protein
MIYILEAHSLVHFRIHRRLALENIFGIQIEPVLENGIYLKSSSELMNLQLHRYLIIRELFLSYQRLRVFCPSYVLMIIKL